MNKLDFTTDNLTEEHKKEMEKHANFNQANITQHYDELASNYEEIYLKVGWPDPRKSADFAIDLQPMVEGKTAEDVAVFDMGCGTGLVG